MRVVCDTEANGLEKPTKVWVIVCKDIDTGQLEIFREPTTSETERDRFLEFAKKVDLWIGHNWLGYDYPVLHDLLGLSIDDVAERSVDTLIVSKMADYSRPAGHSIEAWGQEFGLEKINFTDFSKYTLEMEEYCVRDVEISHRVYSHFHGWIELHAGGEHRPLLTEQLFQLRCCNKLHSNGFAFNSASATTLYKKISKDLEELDGKILAVFPPREKKIRDFSPRTTKFGTISKSSVPRVLHSNISSFEIGKRYALYKLEAFNPSSPKQIVEVLNEAGWKPVDKTKTHIEAERRHSLLTRSKERGEDVDLELIVCDNDLLRSRVSGWKINEANISTLPEKAPPPARLLAKRILLESRRRTLEEWLGLVRDDGRIHGKFFGIGAWTQRMAHQNPNTANIPSSQNMDGTVKLLGKEFRSLWCAPKKRLLVGVDAEGIQLRIFAHYINDPEFTQALIDGKKSDGTDPHSLNKRILGDHCRTRAAAKRFIYALLLGAGLGKLAEILGCSRSEAEEALARLIQRYSGFEYLKRVVIPQDAERGFFIGLDGRRVTIFGDTASKRRHLCMSGYLQNGEVVVMKRAALLWHQMLDAEVRTQRLKDYLFVNMVHDEWQTEVPNNLDVAVQVAKIQADSLRIVGEELGLKCPLAGSYWNEDKNDYTIGVNWYATH